VQAQCSFRLQPSAITAATVACAAIAATPIAIAAAAIAATPIAIAAAAIATAAVAIAAAAVAIATSTVAIATTTTIATCASTHPAAIPALSERQSLPRGAQRGHRVPPLPDRDEYVAATEHVHGLH
jgi:hypothetical protein